MNKSEAIKKMKAEVKHNLLKSKIYHTFQLYGLLMPFSNTENFIALGVACGLVKAISYLDDKFNVVEYYSKAVQDAEIEIAQMTKDKIDFEQLYVLVGRNPEMYKQDLEESTLAKSRIETGFIKR